MRETHMGMPLSPCVGVCQLDESNGLCRGCARTRDEVARWSRMTAAEQNAVWRALDERRGADTARHRMLPWDDEARRMAVEASLALDSHAWSIGTWGAVAEFHRAPDEAFDSRAVEHGVEAETPRGAMRIERIGKARAFLGTDASTVAFAVHKARTARNPARTITDLGPDQGAVRDQDRAARLFDLGLGQPHMALCVRTADADLTARLEAACGAPLFDAPDDLLRRLKDASPHRVACSVLGRIEVYQPIAEHGAATPEGPHTHLLPDLLAENKRCGPDLILPPTYFAALMLYRGGPPANGRSA
jgi:predicted Fe-S protein YdhL (DUF1289 family)